MEKNSDLQVIEFNEKNKVGDTIIYLNEQKQEVAARTRFHAEVLDSGLPVVYVKGNIYPVNINDVL